MTLQTGATGVETQSQIPYQGGRCPGLGLPHIVVVTYSAATDERGRTAAYNFSLAWRTNNVDPGRREVQSSEY